MFRFSSTTVAVLTGRCLEQWMVKCLDCFKHECSTDRFLNEWNGAWRQLLEIILNQLEHQIDTVRYSAKNAFQFYLQIHLFLRGKKIKKWFNRLIDKTNLCT